MSDRIEPPFVSHRPDLPFGCAATWGEPLPAHPDGRVHICNREGEHRGIHRCACGAERWVPDA